MYFSGVFIFGTLIACGTECYSKSPGSAAVCFGLAGCMLFAVSYHDPI
jgi:hypothetical protein